jgi:hypothetical protein
MSKSEHPPEAPMNRREELLLEFLSEHDAPCPVCGYSLTALTRPVCPECRHDLVLTVGVTRPHLVWLFAAVAPGFFSGIAAFFVLIPIVLRFVYAGAVSPAMVALDLFGWCSGALAIIIVARRMRFIAQARARQQWWAAIIWTVHVAALAGFIVFGPAYM